MGNSVSSAVKKMEQQQDEAEAQMKQELAQLSATLKAKEEEFKMSLIAPDAANKLLPIDTIVKMDSKQQVDVSTAPSEKMNAMIEDMFGGNFLKALKGLILGALDAVLGNASVGEKESSGMACILMHSAIVRVDYFVYAYTLRSDGAKTHLQNGLVFAVSMSTIKLEAVNSEVIALLSGLTAENSVSFVNNLANKFNLFADNIARNPIAYTSADCIGYIRGYFYDNMDDTQHTDFEKLEKQANTTKTNPDAGGGEQVPDEDAQAEAKTNLNQLFDTVAGDYGKFANKPDEYSSAECVQNIQTYFLSTMTPEDKSKFQDLQTDAQDDAKKDQAQTELNALLKKMSKSYSDKVPANFSSSKCIAELKKMTVKTADQKKQLTALTKQSTATKAKPVTGDGPQVPDDDARADAREQLNKMLASVAREFSIEKSTTSQITDLQEQLLDQMIKIYDKINEMKRSTAASIDGKAAPRITA